MNDLNLDSYDTRLRYELNTVMSYFNQKCNLCKGLHDVFATVQIPKLEYLLNCVFKLDIKRKTHTALKFFKGFTLGPVLGANFMRELSTAIKTYPGFKEFCGFEQDVHFQTLCEEIRKFVPFCYQFIYQQDLYAKQIGLIKDNEKLIFDATKVIMTPKRHENTSPLKDPKTKETNQTIKVHFSMTSESKIFLVPIIRTGSIHENTVFNEQLGIALNTLGEVYSLFDRGYIDKARFWQMTHDGLKFTTVLKSNMVYYVVEDKNVSRKDKKVGVLKDRVVTLKDFPETKYRLIQVKTDQNKKGYFEILTNDFKKFSRQIRYDYGDRFNIEFEIKDLTKELLLKYPSGFLEETYIGSILFKIITYNYMILYRYIKSREDVLSRLEIESCPSFRKLLEYVRNKSDIRLEETINLKKKFKSLLKYTMKKADVIRDEEEREDFINVQLGSTN